MLKRQEEELREGVAWRHFGMGKIPALNLRKARDKVKNHL